jgi:hypothetical protein
MSSKLKIWYIDDDPKEGKRLQSRLSRTTSIDCRFSSPPSLGELNEDWADLYLIDYDLTRIQPDGGKVDYQGSTLASEIRTRVADKPIVLITRGSIYRDLKQSKPQVLDQLQIYDDLILKDELDEDLKGVTSSLITLSQGFRDLSRSQRKDWQALTGVLNANEHEARILREAVPPLSDGRWFVSGAARWVRHVVLGYPGILYDEVHAATRLGISIEGFRKSSLQRVLKSAKYDGAFGPNDGRWWKDRLLGIAAELIQAEGLGGPLNETFREAYRRKMRVKLLPAICVWDNTPTADWVCYLLHKPVKIKHSLHYYPDNRPAVMDDARVSFRAVREMGEFDDNLLDADGAKLLNSIEDLADPQRP